MSSSVKTVGQIISKNSEMILTQQKQESLQILQDTTPADAQVMLPATLSEHDKEQVERIKQNDLIAFTEAFNVKVPAKMANRDDEIIYGDRMPMLKYAALKFGVEGVIDVLKAHILVLFDKCALNFANEEARSEAADEAARTMYANCKAWRINTVMYFFYVVVLGKYGTLKFQFNLSQFMEIVQKFNLERVKKVAEIYEQQEAAAKAKAREEQEQKAARCYRIFEAAARQELGKGYFDLSDEEQRKLREWIYETNFQGFLTSKKAENDAE